MEGNRRLLTFTLEGELYALELGQVAEIVEAPATFPIPRAPAHFTGVMNSHGNLVPILDVCALLKTAPVEGQGKVLVLDRGIANLALKVERIAGIVPCDTILEEHPAGEEMVEKVLQLAEGEIKLLAAGRLVKRLERTINDQRGGHHGA